MSIASFPKLSRRSFLAATGLAGAGLALGACGGGSAGDFTQPPGDIPKEFANRQRIVVWSPFNEPQISRTLDTLTASFNSSQDQIYADVQFQGRYPDTMTKVVAGIRARQTPDIAILAKEAWGSLYLSDAITPLDDFYDDDFPLSGYSEAFLAEGQVRGRTYWVPFARSAPLFYYNRNLFAKAGLPDRGPQTWSELREWGRRFRSKFPASGHVRMYGYSAQDLDWQFQGILWNFGAAEANGLDVVIDSDRAIAAGEFTRATVFDDGSARLAKDIVAEFQNGTIASAAMSTASLRGLLDLVDFDLSAAFMPSEVTPAIATGGGGFVMLSGVPQERKQSAMEYVKFLARPAQAAAWSTGTGYIPATIAAENDPAYRAAVDKNPLFALAAKQLVYARETDTLRAWVPDVGRDVWNTLEIVWGDNQKPADLFPPLADQLRRHADNFRDDYEEKVAV
ncbi:ABC transporter substrate-binding protein [Mycobacterium sp. NPDC003449]